MRTSQIIFGALLMGCLASFPSASFASSQSSGGENCRSKHESGDSAGATSLCTHGKKGKEKHHNKTHGSRKTDVTCKGEVPSKSQLSSKSQVPFEKNVSDKPDTPQQNGFLSGNGMGALFPMPWMHRRNSAGTASGASLAATSTDASSADSAGSDQHKGSGGVHETKKRNSGHEGESSSAPSFWFPWNFKFPGHGEVANQRESADRNNLGWGNGVSLVNGVDSGNVSGRGPLNPKSSGTDGGGNNVNAPNIDGTINVNGTNGTGVNGTKANGANADGTNINSDSTKQLAASVPPVISLSFVDFHAGQLKNLPMTARHEALVNPIPVVVPQNPRTHQDWGMIGGMSPGGLTMTEPPSPNNMKGQAPNQFVKPTQVKDASTAYGDTTAAGFHTEPGPPNRPFWFTQPAVNNPADTHMYPVNSSAAPLNDFNLGVFATAGSMANAESAGLVDFNTAQAKTQAETQQFGDAANNASNANLQSGMNSVVQSLVNIANENSGGTYARAVHMIQAMWKTTFIPLSILLVLPGALITQVKGLVKFGIINDANDEDAVSPFTGILRATIAVFLIPATQMIVSYSVDIGNSLTNVVAQQVQLQSVSSWADSQTGREHSNNPTEQAKLDANQSGKSAFKRAAFGFINSLFTNALVILLAYQTVMICYLYLLGPIAAALFAWPSTTNVLFKNVFANWINGLISLSLWRFWWSLIILCMCIRIQWLKDLGEYNPNSPWEGVVYTAFVAMLTYIPFMPFEFKPGMLVSNLLSQAGLPADSTDGSTGTNTAAVAGNGGTGGATA